MSTLQVLQEASLVNVILVLGTVPYKSPLEHPHNSSSPMPKPQPHTFGDKSHSLTLFFGLPNKDQAFRASLLMQHQPRQQNLISEVMTYKPRMTSLAITHSIPCIWIMD